jgi:CheY-like chemotaxis protein
LRREAVPLGAVISGAVEAVRPLLDSSEHDLAIDLGGDPLVVEGDTARLTQIFGNILQNAAKFTARHGKIEISARRNGGEAVIMIKDNGPGIPAPMLSRIFDMFQLVDQTLERSHGGLGIGLTLVKRLVDLHGGCVEARSDGPEKGSEFIVTLPLMVPGPGVPQLGETETCNAGQVALPSFKVLVVDDVQASAKTLAIMLRAIGQQAEVIHDGTAVVNWVLEHRPAFVFLDIAMPGMSGYDVARQIRGREELRDVFLVALTGYSQDEDRRRAIDAGFDQHLTKPTSIDQLQQLLMGKSRRAQTD